MLVIPIGVPVLSLAVVFVRTVSPPTHTHTQCCLFGGGPFRKDWFPLAASLKQHLPATMSIVCEPLLFLISAHKTPCQKDIYFLFGVTQTCFSHGFYLYGTFHKITQSTETSVV